MTSNLILSLFVTVTVSLPPREEDRQLKSLKGEPACGRIQIHHQSNPNPIQAFMHRLQL